MKAVIVDDEAPARRKLKRLVESASGWTVVAEADDVASAVTAIENHAPDVVLLDLQLKTGTGFDVLARLGKPMPCVVFVTAFDEYAVKAFEVHAQDYLLKPVEPQRFGEMVKRLEALHGEPPSRLAERLDAVLRELRPAPKFAERLLVTAGDRGRFVDVSDIVWIKADGNYLRIQTRDGDGKHRELRQRGTLAELHAKLDPASFLRVNRSTVVNAAAIREVQMWFKGERVLLMTDGAELKATRVYWDGLA